MVRSLLTDNSCRNIFAKTATAAVLEDGRMYDLSADEAQVRHVDRG